MAQKTARFKIKGMFRDLTESSFQPQYAYEMKNMRIYPTDDNTLLSVVNEKGSKCVLEESSTSPLKDLYFPINFNHHIIGTAQISKYLILFLTDNAGHDKIVRLEKTTTGNFKVTYLFGEGEGADLGFSLSNPIETLVSYENEATQKVYWVDGLNQPRVINVAKTDQSYTSSSFDFLTKLTGNEYVTITRSDYGGMFAAGVIQYTLTYINITGVESNTFYTSPQYYTSYPDRGGSPENTVNNSFTITISNVDKTNYQYIRVYSIMRTSLNGEVIAKRVKDVEITSTTMTILDTGMEGETIESTEVLFNSRPQIVAGTLSSKDNTLFIGNIRNISQSVDLSETAKKIAALGLIRGHEYESSSTSVTKRGEGTYYPFGNNFEGTYSYKNTLFSPNNRIFKYLEFYRFGIQFQFETGEWSEPYFIADIQNTIFPPYSKKVGATNDINKINDSQLYYEWYHIRIQEDSTLYTELSSYKIIKIRPLVVFPDFTKRSIICQGVANPTVFNVKDRATNSPFVQASWFFRPFPPFKDRLPSNRDTAPLEAPNLYGHTVNDTPVTVDEGKLYYWAPIGCFSSWKDTAKGGDLNEGRMSRRGVVTDEAYIGEFYYEEEDGSRGTRSVFDYTIPSFGATLAYNHFDNITYKKPTLEGNKYIRSMRGSEFSNSINSPNGKEQWGHYPGDPTSYISTYGGLFFVDQSIITINSPDIEWDDSILSIIGSEDVKLRIVGFIPFTAFMNSKYLSTTSAATDTGGGYTPFNVGVSMSDYNFYTHNISQQYTPKDNSTSLYGYKTGCAVPIWHDSVPDYGGVYFFVSPWHESGTLGVSNENDAVLQYNKTGNYRYSYNTLYLVCSSNKASGTEDTGIVSNVFWDFPLDSLQVFNSTEVSPIMLKSETYSNTGRPYITYYGNVNTVIPPIASNTYKSPSNTTTQEAEGAWGTSSTIPSQPIALRYKSTPHVVAVLGQNTWGTGEKRQWVLPYPGDTNCPTYYPMTEENTSFLRTENTFPEDVACTGIKTFWGDDNYIGIDVGYVDVTTCIESPNYNVTTVDPSNYKYMNKNRGPYSYSANFGGLWMVEIYRPYTSINEVFGDSSKETLASHTWYVAGDEVSTRDGDFDIIWSSGDTYYQRYDCLKTYLYSSEDPNQVTEILSFMCETRVNIDGRYDRNRGSSNITSLSPQNFNLMNEVYSQKPNYFAQRTDNSTYKEGDYSNYVAWSKTKTIGEKVDTWTDITLASTLDLDGVLGKITKLDTLNNQLIAFQEKGFSQILYNEQTQITSTSGVPIEIANSAKVTGKRYFSNSVGLPNKWAECRTPNGIYFIDDYTKGIYLFNGELINLSDKFGFHSWINKNSTSTEPWNPVDFNNFVIQYDKTNGDVFFINGDSCLVFSEPLGNFTSFYDYARIPYFVNIEDEGYWILNNKYGYAPTESGTYTRYALFPMYKHNSGTFNKYLRYNEESNPTYGHITNIPVFGTSDLAPQEPLDSTSYITLIVNDNPTEDKIFNTLEFRGDVFSELGTQTVEEGSTLTYLPDEVSFNTLKVWNEYQDTGEVELGLDKDYSKGKMFKKFRIWRTSIPRDNKAGAGKGKDRIRNPWSFLKLSYEGNNFIKVQDFAVHYTE